MPKCKIVIICSFVLLLLLSGCQKSGFNENPYWIDDGIDWIADRPHNIPPEKCPRDCQRLFTYDEYPENIDAKDVDFIFRQDMSILWTLPQGSVFYCGSELEAFKNVYIFSDDGEQVGKFGGRFWTRYMSATSIIAPLVIAYPNRPCHIIV